MQPIISVIIPIYNSEKYLDECISSVLNQSFLQFELVLVVDQSIDNSLCICNMYAKRDKRVVVIERKERSTQALARNIGISIAKGEWIVFVDSDDWLESDALSFLYEKVNETDIDIFIASFFKNYKDRECVVHNKVDSFLCTGEKINDLLMSLVSTHYSEYLSSTISVPVWGKIYRTVILKDEKYQALNKIRVYEDLLFNCYAYKCASKVGYSDHAIIHWRIRNESASSKKTNLSEEELVEAINQYSDFIQGNCNDTKYTELLDILKGKALARLIRVSAEKQEKSYVVDFKRRTKLSQNVNVKTLFPHMKICKLQCFSSPYEKIVIFFLKHKMNMGLRFFLLIYGMRTQLNMNQKF